MISFSNDFNENIENLILEYSSSISSFLITLLKECFWAYKNERYQICVPALFAVLEGLLVELSNDGNRKSIRYINGISSHIERGDITIEVMPLLSISYFLELTFSPSDFNGEEIDVINRHWSQHGRYMCDLTKKAPLQLFNAVALVLFTNKFIKE